MIGSPVKNSCLIFVFLLGYTCIQAQQTHRYTLTSNQPSLLSVDAGDDIQSSEGEVETLGGDPVANGGTLPYTYLWTPSQDLSDDQEANPTVTTGSSDLTYSVTVTDASGCTATDEVTLFSVTTSLMSGSKTSFDVFPNPVHSLLTIQTGQNQGTVTLIDSKGKEVLKEAMMPFVHTIDTHSFSQGIYLLKIQVDHSEQTVRVVVQ